jgi:oligoribonuclease NrnB/cAMP/cGMP phosphodiesterase (DHH superfamily)
MKVKLFTHTDLDGVGCAIVAKHVYKDADIEYCNYDEINQKVREYLSNRDFLDYELTLITDISIDEVNADIINYHYNLGNKFKLLDHHPTAEWLNKYKWATVNSLHEDGTKSSGTTMLYDYLNHPLDLYEFSEKVRRYDTWEWATKFNDTHAKQLNDLLYLIGRDSFVTRFLFDPSIEFTETESTILNMEQGRIKSYIENKEKQLKVFNILSYQAGVVFAEQYYSELGNELAKKFDYIDFIVIINPSTAKISYRGIKENIDLGKDVAKVFGGGGHPKAAGSQIEEELIDQFIVSLFNK